MWSEKVGCLIRQGTVSIEDSYKNLQYYTFHMFLGFSFWQVVEYTQVFPGFVPGPQVLSLEH